MNDLGEGDRLPPRSRSAEYRAAWAFDLETGTKGSLKNYYLISGTLLRSTCNLSDVAVEGAIAVHQRFEAISSR